MIVNRNKVNGTIPIRAMKAKKLGVDAIGMFYYAILYF